MALCDCLQFLSAVVVQIIFPLPRKYAPVLYCHIKISLLADRCVFGAGSRTLAVNFVCYFFVAV